MLRYNPMNAAELMDCVFDIYKKTFIRQLAFSALVGVVSFAAILLMGFAVGMIAAMNVVSSPLSDPASDMTGIFIAVVSAMLPLYFIGSAAADAGYIALSKQAFYRQSHIYIPVRQLPGMVLRILSSTLVQLLLSLPWLAVIGIFVFTAVRSAGGYMTSSLETIITALSSNTWIVLSIIGALLYVVYSNVFSLSVPAAVFEKCVFHKTIKRSWQLVKGDFWQILGLRLLWIIVVYLFTYSAEGLWVLIAGLIGSFADGAMGPSFWALTIGSLFQSLFILLIGFLMGPLQGILTALLYFNQRIKKEGLDIEIAIEHLHSQQIQI